MGRRYVVDDIAARRARLLPAMASGERHRACVKCLKPRRDDACSTAAAQSLRRVLTTARRIAYASIGARNGAGRVMVRRAMP